MDQNAFLEGVGNGDDEAGALYHHYRSQEDQAFLQQKAREVRQRKERIIANMSVAELERLDAEVTKQKKEFETAQKSFKKTIEEFVGFFVLLIIGGIMANPDSQVPSYIHALGWIMVFGCLVTVILIIKKIFSGVFVFGDRKNKKVTGIEGYVQK
ncbi:hypothetical protein [Sulfuriferula thiophila]|uniref:hypothetical protein n=1 Tax=Sulfuriferula thiophila TaxID=1781211 RepID=UPI000F611945|nr:hypothetical protein [Sulfuriferula thiophila]